MVNLTLNELRLTGGRRGIKNKNMSREKLLTTLDESERNFQNLSQNGLERITKMQNLSQNELEQIKKMLNLSQNELEQIAKMRRIKAYKNMSKEGLLVALLKSECSLPEPYKSKSNNTEIEETKKSFNELRDKFSRSKIKEIRKKFYKKEKIEQYFKELEKKNISKKEEKKLKRYHQNKKRTKSHQIEKVSRL